MEADAGTMRVHRFDRASGKRLGSIGAGRMSGVTVMAISAPLGRSCVLEGSVVTAWTDNTVQCLDACHFDVTATNIGVRSDGA